MLRPSRPMIRPFISSPGRCSTETTDSLVCSVATRWMARVTILRARLSPSTFASCSMSLTMSAASRLAWFSMTVTSSALAASAVRPAMRSSSLRRFGVLCVQLSGAAVEVLPPGRLGLRTVFDPLELVVQPLLAVGEAQLAALEVAAQLADLVLDRADFLFDVPAALGGLFGLFAGSFQDPGGFGLGAGADLVRFLAGRLELGAVLCRGDRRVRRGRGPAPEDNQREHHREQPDHDERERQCAAHGHPFPSIALGALLCCDSWSGFEDLCPRAGSRTRRPAGCSPGPVPGYLTYLPASPPLNLVLVFGAARDNISLP